MLGGAVRKMNEFEKDESEGYFPPGTKHEDETYEMNGLYFVWDKAKNKKNLEIHGIDFKTAALVFNDDYCLIDEDYEHSEGEDRESITGQPVDPEDVLEIPGIGSIPRAIIGEVNNVLFVVYTVRARKGIDYRRIISARPADKDEKELYESLKYESFNY